ncbi:DUF4369 domain-containing protein [Prevotella sp. HUN102]|uniref:DUF4369 domain-containing protein n=1 Tax=Prevotella sp. HUN102 TaxID=1392486 RepID=UPI00048F6A9D|nr:DUF4369 domain-containing protein [Prevotella sp. HUN102]
MENMIRKTALPLLLCAVSFLTSCTGEQFHVEGSIANAKDSLLYFEHNTLSGFQKLDSVKLDETGKFAFAGDKIDNPEFYRLRISGQIINIAIDSTETVNVKAAYPEMAYKYEVKGSYENEKIRELALKQIDLQSRCQTVYNESPAAADSLVKAMIADFKKDVTTNYIFKEPMKAYSYFALFQYIIVGRQAIPLFAPALDPADNKVFGAVATSWDTFYPNSERGQNLHNITIKGMQDQRIVEAKNQEIELEATEAGLIDLPLRDNKGNERHLTDLKGRVVLLNFHTFAAKGSPQYIMKMRELYAKYQARGFEIYMVSLDGNEHFWKESVASLPWINVYDNKDASIVYLSQAAVSPVIYLIDRENNVVKNPSQLQNLEAEIQALL